MQCNDFRTWLKTPLRLCLTFLLLSAVLPGWSQVSVLTQHNDNLRTGANLNETTLTTSNVNTGTFGKLFSCPVDGFVYAQPLYVPNVAIAGGTHNVLYVATAHDSVYAFDADTGEQLLTTSLGVPVPSSVINTPNIQVEVGIISTPVIDPASGSLYVVAKTYANQVQQFWLHALDITTLQDKVAPVQITAQVPGTGYGTGHAGDNDGQHVFFVAAKENQRPAVTLVNGVLYLAFASHEDYDDYHGWVLAYNASSLTQIAAYNDTPNGRRGGIWMSGQGLVADAANNVYLITGNSSNSSENSVGDFGESFVKLTLSGSSLTVGDYFKAGNYDSLNAGDTDLGSGGAVGIPGTTDVVGGGKQGLLYVVNTTNMGQLNTSSDQVVQEFQADNALWGCPIFWNSATPTLYVWGVGDKLKAYHFANGLFTTTPSSVSTVSTPGGGISCGVLSVSSNGNAAGTGIVWATAPLGNPDHSTVSGLLYAFDAANVANKLWDSSQAAGDAIGKFAKYCAPTVANGKVYVGTDAEQVCVYGLLPPALPVAPTNLTATAGDTVAALSWTAAPHATDYIVKRATQSGGPYSTVMAGVTAANYVDQGLTDGTTYYYVVSSHNTFGESAANSNQASVTPSASAHGTIISMNFVGNAPTPMAASESAGVVAALDWNNGAGNQGSLPSLLDNLGLPTTASAVWTANDPWAIGLADTPGNYRMMNGYLDSSPTSTTAVTVSSLPSYFMTNGYDVYVYCNGDTTGRAGDYTLGGTTIQAQDTSKFIGTFIQASNSGGNYVKFPGLTGSSFTLNAHASATAGGFRAPVNGLQIVAHPPPPVLTSIVVSPALVDVLFGHTQQFTAVADDQYGNPLSPQPSVTWKSNGGGVIRDAGLFRSNAVGGPFTVTATIGTVKATATVYEPSAPQSLTATPGNGQVTLTWNKPAGTVTSYTLLYGTTPGAENVTVANLTATTVTVTGLTNGQTYSFVVSAVNPGGVSLNSAEVRATPAASASPALTAMTPIADSYVWSGTYADQNKGTIAFLTVANTGSPASSHDRCAYLKFDLTGLTQAPSSAKLSLTVDGSSSPATGSATVQLWSVADTSWTELSLNWNNAPGLNLANFTSTGSLVGTQSVSLQSGAAASYDLTSFIAGHLGQVVSLQLIDPNVDGLTCNFVSREGTTGKPTLSVTY